MTYYKVTTKDSGAAGALRMHSSADTMESTVIGSVPKGAVVKWVSIYPETNGMIYVTYNNLQGWVSVQYLTPSDENGTTNNTNNNEKSNDTPDTTDNTPAKQKTKGKTWLILGGCALAIGAAINIFR